MTKPDFENCICCLDDWVNKTNMDQKQNIWDFNWGRIFFFFFGFKWCPIIEYMILWKLHGWGKYGSQFIGQNALCQSDYRIFWTLITQTLYEV